MACQLTVLGLIVPRRMQRLLLLVAHSLNHRLARETTAPMTSDRIAAGSGIVHAHLYFLNVDPDLDFAVLTAEPRNKPWPPGEDGWAGAAGTLFLHRSERRPVRALHGADTLAPLKPCTCRDLRKDDATKNARPNCK